MRKTKSDYSDIIYDVPVDPVGSYSYLNLPIDYNARYFIMENQDGEHIVIDRWDYIKRYKKMARSFVNYTQLNGLLYYKHITLTQSKESYKPNILNNFFNCLRRRYGELAYIWTAEIQEQRLQTYGDAVLHWHVIVAFQVGTDINVDEISRLQKYWKYGNLDVRSVKKLNLGYILKYITKSLNNAIETVYKIRRISMSRIPQFYRHIKKNIVKAIEWAGCNLERLFGFYKVDKKGIYYSFYDEFFKRSYKEYALIFNSWQLIGTYESEPF